MNFRIAISLAALLLFAVNTALVISEIPPCPVNDDGRLAALPGVPGWIPCPTPPDYNCDEGKTEWEITGKQWIIQTSLGGPYVASSEGVRIPKVPGREDGLYWESFEVDIIAKTGALCSGRRYIPIDGHFSPKRSGDKDDFVMQDYDDDCYYIGNCNWCSCGTLDGWVLKGNEYHHEPQPNYRCTSPPSDTAIKHRIWAPCSVDTGY